MIERFLKQTKFTSEQDFKEHLEFIIPEDFNFAYDVMDEWAKIKPDHVALLWASERGEEIRFTYKDLKEQSDKAAACLVGSEMCIRDSFRSLYVKRISSPRSLAQSSAT